MAGAQCQACAGGLASGPNPFEVDANALQTYVLDLSVARANPTRIPIAGSFLWAQNASSIDAKATIAFGDRSKGAGLNAKLGFLVRSIRFTEIWVSNAAQAGAWLLLVYLPMDRESFAVGQNVGDFTTVDLSKSQTTKSYPDVVVANGAAAAQILAANTARRSVLIGSLSANTQDVRIGDANIGAAQGQVLQAGLELTLETTAAIYAWTAGGADQTLTLLEVND